MTLRARTLFITGASRGIGHAIAMRAAADGANIVIAAKTTEPHPKLPGTIHTAAADVEARRRAGARGRRPTSATKRRSTRRSPRRSTRFGGIDILVNNASAISLTGTLDTPMKRFDLMHQINTRGTFLCTQKARAASGEIRRTRTSSTSRRRCIRRSARAGSRRTSPTRWRSTACRCACSAWRRSSAPHGIAVNALWPRTTIDTEAIRLIAGQEARAKARSPRIMADAAHWILTQPSRKVTGRFFLDDEVLRSAGVTDFSRYRPAGVRAKTT